MPKLRSRGFTLVEILVTMVIIGILSTVGIVSYIGAQKSARDVARKNDIYSLATSLELYYQVTRDHPPDETSPQVPYDGSSNACVTSSGLQFNSKLVPKYIESIPNDPKASGGDMPSSSNPCYFYRKGPGVGKFTLYAKLEVGLPADDPKKCTSGPGGAVNPNSQIYRDELIGYNYCYSVE